MHDKIQALVLAAGKSTRFKKESSKLIESLCGKPVISYQARLFHTLKIDTTFIIGFDKEAIRNTVNQSGIKRHTFIEQEEQLGTGHAVACSKDVWVKDHILVCNGDIPLITQEIIEKLYTKHVETNAAISFVTSHATIASGQYGRVIKNDNHIKIIEVKDAPINLEEHCCINGGIYLFEKNFLKTNIEKIEKRENTGEYYLTDIVEIASNLGLQINTIEAPFDRIRGINTLEELWAAEQVKRSELIKYHMNHGVRFLMPQNTHIDTDVEIGTGTIIGGGVQLLGHTIIKTNCVVSAFSIIEDAIIDHDVIIKPYSMITLSEIKQYAQVGPFAYIRQDTVIDHSAVAGAFVEIKKTTLGKYSKAKHLTYLGDTTIGQYTNIGGGTIVANHNGTTRHETIIDENVYVGANTTFVAPVHIAKNAYIGAGSTITINVPTYTLAIARSRQLNKSGYVPILKQKFEDQRKKTLEKKANFEYIMIEKKKKEEEFARHMMRIRLKRRFL